MWETFYAGITSTGPIVAMLLFMVVFLAATVRSFLNHQSDDQRAQIPLDDGVVGSSSPFPHSEVRHVQ